MAAEPVLISGLQPAGPRIPGYEIESIIGRGSTGTVWRARQLAVDREVALKILHREMAAKTSVVRRLQREARTSARLAHPHLVSAIDMGETEDGLWWYAMEIVDGPSLALRLRQEGRLEEREALRLFIPLVEALEHLADHGVVHRDIKPANILIDKSGGARLADLGLAFAGDDPELTNQGGTLGTPHYMSPEQAIDPRRADVRSDLWSLGATLFHGVCGRPPFTGESTAEVLSAVLYARIPDPLVLEPGLSKGLTLVLRKCLVRDPEGRYQTPRELLLDLERVRERRAPKVTRSALDPVERNRDPRVLWGSLALGTLGVAAAGILLFRTFIPEKRTHESGSAPGYEPFAPLEALGARVELEPRALAEQLEELAALEPRIPPADRARFDELETRLLQRLRTEVQALREETLARVDELLRAKDFVAATEALGDSLDRALLERTGFRRGELVTRASLETWLELARGKVLLASKAALSALRSAAEERARRLVKETRELEARSQWRRARSLLVAEEDAVLEELGFRSHRWPREALDEALGLARTTLFARLLELDEAWAAFDRQLEGWVQTRASSLRGELASMELRAGGGFGAAARLQEAFARQLAERGLTLESMPEGLAQHALEELELRARELEELEDQRLEIGTRAFLAETERRTVALFARRDYAAAAGLWSASREELESASVEGSAWRRQLTGLIERRSAEALLLSGLLERAALSLGAKDGQVLESLTVGSVGYTRVKLVVGLDPLETGFSFEGVPGTFHLRDLPATELVSLAGLDSVGELADEDALARVLLYFHDGDLEGARAILREGGLPNAATLGDLARELSDRVLTSIEAVTAEQRVREKDVQLYFEYITEQSIEDSPRQVLEWVETLLTEFEDVPEVKRRRAELLELERRLRDGAPRPSAEQIQARFGPRELAFPRLGRVRLSYAFDAETAGAWERGEWRFDGQGWALPSESRIKDFDDFRQRTAPTLILRSPLDPDAGSFEFELAFEAIDPTTPHKLLVVSVAGFHVALVGAGLPGGDGTARWLVGTSGLEALLEAILDGEGVRTELFTERSAVHALRLEGWRRSGTLELELDGSELRTQHHGPPDKDELSIVLRSWDPLRVTRIVVETGL